MGATAAKLTRAQRDENWRFNRDVAKARTLLQRGETLTWGVDGWTSPSCRWPLQTNAVMALVRSGEGDFSRIVRAPMADLIVKAAQRPIRLIKGIHDHD